MTRNNNLNMVRTLRRQTSKGLKKTTDDKRQAQIADIRKQLGILPTKPPVVDESPYDADTAEETDRTEQAAASTPKDPIDIDNYDDKKMMTKTRMTSAMTQRMMVRSKKTTPCTLGQRGSRDARNVRRSHYYLRIATMTTIIMTKMTITLNQVMTRVRRRRNQEGPPRVPY